MADQQAVDTLSAFAGMLDEYERLLLAEQLRVSPRPYVISAPNPDPRLGALRREIQMEVERVKALVDRALGHLSSVASIFRFSDDPYHAMLSSTAAVEEVRGLVIRAAGWYRAQAPAAPARPTTPELDLAFVSNDRLRTVLERNVLELRTARLYDAYTAVIVLAGATAEGVLCFLLTERRDQALQAVARINERNGDRRIRPNGIESWRLATYIDVANELGYLANTTRAMAHGVLREFRNMIHPGVQLREELSPTRHAADGSIIYLQAVVDDARQVLVPAR